MVPRTLGNFGQAVQWTAWGRSPEPSRQIADLEIASLGGDDRVEVIFDSLHPFAAKLADPASPKAFEDLCTEAEHLFATWAPDDQRCSRIVGGSAAE